jgi:hypothetical protein
VEVLVVVEVILLAVAVEPLVVGVVEMKWLWNSFHDAVCDALQVGT